MCNTQSRYHAMSLTVLAIIVLTVPTTSAADVVNRPTKPTFLLQDATLYSFNLTKSNTFLNTTLRVTLSAHNLNRRTGIDYDTLGMYASYRGQQITMFADLVQGYLGPEKVTVWSLLLSGDGEVVPVSPSTASAVSHDLRAGLVVMNVTVNGRMRWKVGSWRSKKYYLAVNCPAYLRSSSGKSGGVGAGIKYRLDQGCSVELSA